MVLVGEIQELKKLNMEKDKKIALLEKRVDDLEQYSRGNDIVISGLETRHRSYANVVATVDTTTERRRAEETEAERESLEGEVAHFLESKGIKINLNDIESCHTLPSKNKNTAPVVIIRLLSRKIKQVILKQGKKLKGTDVYIHEHLTKKNSDIARRARMLKKHKKIQATWTSNCKVYIKLNGSTPEESKVHVIRDINELDRYET